MRMSKPEIRFPEFSESWIQSKISEHFIFKNGINKEKEAFGKGTPIINFKDVYNERVLKNENIKGLITISDKEKSAFLVKKGDLFFTRTSETPSGIGMSASLLEDISECIFSGFVLRARPISDDLIPTFNAYRFSTNSVRKEIITKSSFTTRALTSGSLLNEVKFFFPQNKNEQQKIADFLSTVDEKIRLLKEKHELLQHYKKGVMQKLFSQEIRFKDDNGQAFPSWKTERVDYFVSRYSKSVKVDPAATYREIGVRSHGKGVFHKSEITGRELGEKRVFWVHPDAFVVNIVFAWEHAVAKTSENEQGFIASHRFPMYIPRNNRADIRFFTIFFKSKRGKHLLELASPGGAGRNKTLGQSNFAELKVTFPCLDEQRKIADFYEALEKKIEAAQQQIDLTQTFKKGLLQQMFV